MKPLLLLVTTLALVSCASKRPDPVKEYIDSLKGVRQQQPREDAPVYIELPVPRSVSTNSDSQKENL